MKKSPSKKIAIILGVVVLGICALYYFIYIDIKKRNEHASVLLHDATLEISRQQYTISLEHTIENITPDIDLVNKSLIAKDGDVDFIENLEGLAKSNGLAITIDSLILDNNNPILEGSDITLLRVKAKTEGNWLGTYTFLSELESMPLKIKVDKLGFASIGDEPQTGTKKQVKSNRIWQSIFEITILKYK